MSFPKKFLISFEISPIQCYRQRTAVSLNWLSATVFTDFSMEIELPAKRVHIQAPMVYTKMAKGGVNVISALSSSSGVVISGTCYIQRKDPHRRLTEESESTRSATAVHMAARSRVVPRNSAVKTTGKDMRIQGTTGSRHGAVTSRIPRVGLTNVQKFSIVGSSIKRI